MYWYPRSQFKKGSDAEDGHSRCRNKLKVAVVKQSSKRQSLDRYGEAAAGGKTCDAGAEKVCVMRMETGMQDSAAV